MHRGPSAAAGDDRPGSVPVKAEVGAAPLARSEEGDEVRVAPEAGSSAEMSARVRHRHILSRKPRRPMCSSGGQRRANPRVAPVLYDEREYVPEADRGEGFRIAPFVLNSEASSRRVREEVMDVPSHGFSP